MDNVPGAARTRPTRSIALLVAGCTAMAAAAGIVAVAAVGVAHAATACQATYTVTNQWPGGFQGDVTVANLGDPLDGWTLRFAFPNGQQGTQAWNATASQSGATITATNASWNASVPTNATLSIGFLASWSGSDQSPSSCSINNVSCGGVAPTTTTTQPPTTTLPPTTTTQPPTTITQPPATTTQPPTTTTNPPSSGWNPPANLVQPLKEVWAHQESTCGNL